MVETIVLGAVLGVVVLFLLFGWFFGPRVDRWMARRRRERAWRECREAVDELAAAFARVGAAAATISAGVLNGLADALEVKR